MSEKDNKEMTILKSNILRPGGKFLITDKTTDGKFLPGSTGFISFVKGVDQQFSNVAHFAVVITKKGKSGKERIETGDMSAPIFEAGLADDEMIMPGPDRRYFVRMEHLAHGVSDVTQMDTYDLMGWVLSRARFLHKLSSKSQYIKVWPQSNVLYTTMELPNHFSENPTRAKEYYSIPSTINEILTVIAKTEARLTKCNIDYMCKTADLELNAIRGLYDFYTSKKAPKEVLDILNDTALYCHAKVNILMRLAMTQSGPGQLTNKIKSESEMMFGTMLHETA